MSEQLKCKRCGNGVYKCDADGNRSCYKCGFQDQDFAEYESQFQNYLSRDKIKVKSTPSKEINPTECTDNVGSLYDWFNTICAAQVDQLVECGAPREIKESVFKLVILYMSKLVKEEAHFQSEDDSQEDYVTPRQPTSQMDKLWSELEDESSTRPSAGASTESDLGESGSSNSQSSSCLSYQYDTPLKKPRKRKRYSKHSSDLADVPEDELIGNESSRKKSKNRLYVRKELKIISSQDDDSEAEECDDSSIAMPTTDDEENHPSKSNSRTALTPRANRRNLVNSPEYLTLHKLLSFFHGALLIDGIQIYDHDIIRWVEEGFIPLHGAHQLLETSVDLGAHGRKITGGANQTPDKAGPVVSKLRENTAKLLRFLDVSEIPKPPVHVVALRIIQDLQLPVELVDIVQELDKKICGRQEWKMEKIGGSVDSGTKYAAVLIIIALKMIFGLDGHSENKLSEFASRANAALKLKASSSFTMRTDDSASFVGTDATEIETLFVWQEWCLFIDYLRVVLEEYHVPSAIRADKVLHIDPERMIRYAETEGKLRCFRSNSGGPVSRLDSHQQVRAICEELVESFLLPPSEQIQFKPALLPRHGLAKQLLRFDPDKFSRLHQTFCQSSLTFALDPKNIAEKLESMDVGVNIYQGPAYEEVDCFVGDYVFASARTLRERKSPISCSSKPAKLNLKPTICSATKLSSELTLHLPSLAYWTREVRGKTTMNDNDWASLSNELPAPLRWTLNTFAASVGEEPKDLYFHLCKVETILSGQSEAQHPALSEKEIKDRKTASGKYVL